MSNPPTTDPALLEALEKAKHHVMTPEEHAAQRRSFMRGMCPSHRDYSEWCEQVDKVLGVQDHADEIESLRAEIAALKAKLAETEKQVYAPGQWRCAKCKFTLTQMAIYADTGVISTNDVPGEKCPNCDGPLWRVTERQCANELGERLEEIAGRAFEAERKLAEREGELTAEEMREQCANYLDEYADGFQEYADGHGFRSAAKTIRALSTKREEG